jgi:hypothetical protein
MRGDFGIEERLMGQLYSCKRPHCTYTKVVFPMAITKNLLKDEVDSNIYCNLKWVFQLRNSAKYTINEK